MQMLKLVSAFFLFLYLLLGIPILFPASQAYADCCGCKEKCFMCTCRGKPGCPYCYQPDSGISLPTALIDKATPDIRAVPDLDSTDRVMQLAKVGDCARRSFALRALGDAGESLKVELFRFGEKSNILDKTVIPKFVANAER